MITKLMLDGLKLLLKNWLEVLLGVIIWGVIIWFILKIISDIQLKRLKKRYDKDADPGCKTPPVVDRSLGFREKKNIEEGIKEALMSIPFPQI